MGKLETNSDPNQFSRPRDDEEALTLRNDWSPQEERKAKRKYVHASDRRWTVGKS